MKGLVLKNFYNVSYRFFWVEFADFLFKFLQTYHAIIKHIVNEVQKKLCLGFYGAVIFFSSHDILFVLLYQRQQDVYNREDGADRCPHLMRRIISAVFQIFKQVLISQDLFSQYMIGGSLGNITKTNLFDGFREIIHRSNLNIKKNAYSVFFQIVAVLILLFS